jgi:hypothetical protein
MPKQPDSIGDWVEHQTDDARKLADRDRRIAELKRDLKTARAAMVEDAEERAASGMVEGCETRVTRIKRSRGKGHQAVSILCLSDVHCGELVDTSTVNGLNAYTPEICKTSVERFFSQALALIESQRHSVHIDRAILWLGGDIITNWLHDDQRESNPLTPQEEVELALQLCASGIQFLLDHGKFREIRVVGSVGNHGRGTVKPRHNMRVRTSWEALIYRLLESHFKGEPRLTWDQPGGKLSYVEVFGRVLRFTHGDEVRGGDGIGGITVPLNKQIMRWDKHQKADVTICGHFHQQHDLRHLVVNGSVIGFSPYSERYGYEPPVQVSFLVDEKYGKRAFEPIMVRGRERLRG